MIIWLAPALLGVAIGSALLRSRGKDAWDRTLALLAPIALTFSLAMVLGHFASRILEADGYHLAWNAARLTPIFALFHGYDLYYGPDSGPILNTIYGPFAYIPYVFSVLATSPTTAVIIAFFSNAVMIVGSSLFLLWRSCKGLERSSLPVFVALAGFVSWILLEEFTRHMCFEIHSDAPSLAFGTMACAFLFGTKDPGDRRLYWSALFAVIAVWAKQIAVPLLPALLVYLWMATGRAMAIRYAVILLVEGLAISGAILLLFGPYEVLYNLLLLPSRHPLTSEPSLRDLTVMLRSTWHFWLITGAALVADRVAGREDEEPEQGWFVRNEWSMLAIVAIFMVPLSMLATKKIGGMYNSLHFLHYMNLFTGVLITRLLSRRAAAASSTRYTQYAVVAVLAGLITLNSHLLEPLNARGRKHESVLYDNALERAYLYSRKNPGRVYFPWHPLAALLGEGRLYHFDYGIFDRKLAGDPPSREHLWANLPEEMRFIATPEFVQKKFGAKGPLFSSKQLREFRRSRARGLKTLGDGWVTFARKAP